MTTQISVLNHTNDQKTTQRFSKSSPTEIKIPLNHNNKKKSTNLIRSYDTLSPQQVTPHRTSLDSKSPLPRDIQLLKPNNFYHNLEVPDRRYSTNETVSRAHAEPLEPSDRRFSLPSILPSTVPVTYNGLPYLLVPATSQVPGVSVPGTTIGYYYSPTLGRLSQTASVGGNNLPTNSPSRICKFFIQGSCKFGENCTFSHSEVPILTQMVPVVIPHPTVLENTYNGMNLSREDCIVVLRLLAHLEEVHLNKPDSAVVKFEQQEVSQNGEVKTVLSPLTVSDVFNHLSNGCSNPNTSLLLSLNELLENEVILTMTECANLIVSVIPEGTLDIDIITDTSKLCDNDGLLFFTILLKDIQEHFYEEEFHDKYLKRAEDTYTYNTENIYNILNQIGTKEEEIYSKLNYDQSKKISQSCKRWRFLFLSNKTDVITLDGDHTGTPSGNNKGNSENAKKDILKRLEDYIITHNPNGKPPSEQRAKRISKTGSKPLPSFSVLFGNEPVYPANRRKLWNEFRASRTPEELCQELNQNVGILKTQGFTNFPAIFNLISSKLKMNNDKSVGGPKNLDEKLSAISDLLTKWPEILLLPETIQRTDGKLRTYYSITQEHQLGAVYEELMMRLKKKFLYKNLLLSELVDKKSGKEKF